MLYGREHEPIEHFALAGYNSLARRIADYSTQPDDEEDDSLRSQDRWRDEQILEMLRAGWPSVKRARRKQSDESPREKVLLFAGQKIDWHLGLPELKVWSGQASLESIIDARVQAIRSHRLPEDATLIDWRVPMGTASGLDARSAVNAIDVGFSPTALGMDVFTFAAAELLGIVGMVVWPIMRFGYREYGYLDENDDLWRFGQVDRDGGHHRKFSAARKAPTWRPGDPDPNRRGPWLALAKS